MPEGNVNAEVAEHLREHGAHDEHAPRHQPSRRRIETIEILEAILLAIVAIVTALSGYQAARWDGESAKEYATSSRLRTEANEHRSSPPTRRSSTTPATSPPGCRPTTPATRACSSSSSAASRPSTRRPSTPGSRSTG